METTDEIRVGDRFEHLDHKGIAVVTGPRENSYPGESPAWPFIFEGSGGISALGVFLDERFWRRLPREPLTIEERRAALKVGDVIKDLALLCEGLRADYGWLGGCDPMVIGANGLPTTGGWTADDRDMFHRSVISHGVVFLGWATEEKPAAESPPLDPITEAMYRPRNPPSAYINGCPDSAKHDGKTMCMRCESFISETAVLFDAKVEPAKPPSRERWEPMRSGLGNGVVGSWNKRAVR